MAIHYIVYTYFNTYLFLSRGLYDPVCWVDFTQDKLTFHWKRHSFLILHF